jgi:hypothetical protein
VTKIGENEADESEVRGVAKKLKSNGIEQAWRDGGNGGDRTNSPLSASCRTSNAQIAWRRIGGVTGSIESQWQPVKRRRAKPA